METKFVSVINKGMDGSPYNPLTRADYTGYWVCDSAIKTITRYVPTSDSIIEAEKFVYDSVTAHYSDKHPEQENYKQYYWIKMADGTPMKLVYSPLTWSINLLYQTKKIRYNN